MKDVIIKQKMEKDVKINVLEALLFEIEVYILSSFITILKLLLDFNPKMINASSFVHLFIE